MMKKKGITRIWAAMCCVLLFSLYFSVGLAMAQETETEIVDIGDHVELVTGKCGNDDMGQMFSDSLRHQQVERSDDEE